MEETTKENVTRPILQRAIVRSDGTRTVGLIVFCGRAEAAISLDNCRRCVAYLETVGAPSTAGACIHCLPRPGAETAGAAPTRTGRSSTAGSLLHLGPLCVVEDAPAPVIEACLAQRPGAELLVVDGRTRLVGIVGELQLAVLRSALELRRTPRGDHRTQGTAAAVMTALVPILETARADDALRWMARSNLRSIPVVTSELIPIGVLSDVAALRACGR